VCKVGIPDQNCNPGILGSVKDDPRISPILMSILGLVIPIQTTDSDSAHQGTINLIMPCSPTTLIATFGPLSPLCHVSSPSLLYFSTFSVVNLFFVQSRAIVTP
jgi:hypothetical protein